MAKLYNVNWFWDSLKGRLTGKIKTENFTKRQDRRIKMEKIE